MLALDSAIIATATTSACHAGVKSRCVSSAASRPFDFNVNRGNCKNKPGGVYPPPLTFKFGDGVKLFAYSCSVKEVTDHGNFTYSFGG